MGGDVEGKEDYLDRYARSVIRVMMNENFLKSTRNRLHKYLSELGSAHFVRYKKEDGCISTLAIFCYYNQSQFFLGILWSCSWSSLPRDSGISRGVELQFSSSLGSSFP